MKIKLQNNIKYWVTSDMHVGHKNVIRYSNRPFSSVEEMDETLIENWNSKVGDNDVVFNLGDFAFLNQKKIIEILENLNGTQYFIYGNHDRLMASDAVQNFCKRSGKIKLFCDVIECNYKKTPIYMCHYAHRVWNKSHYGCIHLYGHSHGSLPRIGRSMDVGVDSTDMPTDYSPRLLDDVVEFLNQQPITKSDHH